MKSVYVVYEIYESNYNEQITHICTLHLAIEFNSYEIVQDK